MSKCDDISCRFVPRVMVSICNRLVLDRAGRSKVLDWCGVNEGVCQGCGDFLYGDPNTTAIFFLHWNHSECSHSCVYLRDKDSESHTGRSKYSDEIVNVRESSAPPSTLFEFYRPHPRDRTAFKPPYKNRQTTFTMSRNIPISLNGFYNPWSWEKSGIEKKPHIHRHTLHAGHLARPRVIISGTYTFRYTGGSNPYGMT